MDKYSFHFSCGNSGTGPVGFCARIVAETEEDAVERLKDLLGEEHMMLDEDDEYIAIYFNDSHISEADIDEADPLEEAA